jgi:hypothetical protein
LWNVTYEDYVCFICPSLTWCGVEYRGIPDWSGVLRIGLACCRLSRHGAQRTGLAWCGTVVDVMQLRMTSRVVVL